MLILKALVVFRRYWVWLYHQCFKCKMLMWTIFSSLTLNPPLLLQWEKMNNATQRCNAASPTCPVPFRTNHDLKRLLGHHKILHNVMIHASASISPWQQILPIVAANVTHRRESRVLKQTTIVRLSWPALLRAAWAGTTGWHHYPMWHPTLQRPVLSSTLLDSSSCHSILPSLCFSVRFYSAHSYDLAGCLVSL